MLEPLDPETDACVWKLLDQISKLPKREQIYATIVAVTLLLADQNEGTVTNIVNAVREMIRLYQSSAEFKKALS